MPNNLPAAPKYDFSGIDGHLFHGWNVNHPAVQPEAPGISNAAQPNVSLPVGATAPWQPTREGAIEYSPTFRAAARDAWESVGAGSQPHAEAGFTVRNNRDIVADDKHMTDPNGEAVGSLKQAIGKNTAVAVHTHPIKSDWRPSPADIADAKKTGKPIMVENQGGLDEVIPGTGEVVHVFDGQDWEKADPMPHKIIRYNKKDLAASDKSKN